MIVIQTGSIFGVDGYSSHVRQLANAVRSLTEDVRISCNLPNKWEIGVTDSEMEMILKPAEKDETVVFVGLPPFWRLPLSEKPSRFFGFLVWEGSHVPKAWKPYLTDKRVSGILVPSLHVRDALFASFKKKDLPPVSIVPHGVDSDLFARKDVPRSDKFTFVANKGWNGSDWDRGGLQYVLRAFTEEFGARDAVRLVCKVNPSYGVNNENFKEKLAGLRLREGADVVFNASALPFCKMHEVYNVGDVFVCGTRAEAFNLPGLEAMSCGLPTVQTGYGGQTDYMTHDNGWPVYFELDFVCGLEQGPMYEGVRWATPHQTHLRSVMRSLYEKGRGSKVLKKMGQNARKTALRWSWENSAEKLLEAVKEKKK